MTAIPPLADEAELAAVHDLVRRMTHEWKAMGFRLRDEPARQRPRLCLAARDRRREAYEERQRQIEAERCDACGVHPDDLWND